MPKKINPLTSAEVRAVHYKPQWGMPGSGKAATRLVAVGGAGAEGLCIQVASTGQKSWILRTMVAGRRMILGLGGYPAVTLEAARTAAREAKAQAKGGLDPKEERRAAQNKLRDMLTFDQAFARFWERKQHELGSEKYKAQVLSRHDLYVSPIIGKRPVSALTRRDVIDVLTQRGAFDKRGGMVEGTLWETVNDTAEKLLNYLRDVFDWCEAHEYRPSGSNPAIKRNLEFTIPKAAAIRVKEHHPKMQLADLPRFMRILRTKNSVSANALEFLILTALRSGDVRSARWSHFDFDRNMWIVPGAAMKGKKGRKRPDHHVPLTADALTVLKQQPGYSVLGNARKGGPDGLVFPSPTRQMLDRPLTPDTLGNVIADAHAAELKAGQHGFVDPDEGHRIAVPHGFRAAFSTWANAARKYHPLAVEAALEHVRKDKVQAAYDRGDYFDERVEMMADWAARIANDPPPAATVTPIESRRRAA